MSWERPLSEAQRRLVWVMVHDMNEHRAGYKAIRWGGYSKVRCAVRQLRIHCAPLVFIDTGKRWRLTRPWVLPFVLWPRTALESHECLAPHRVLRLELELDAMLGPLS
jgi:hypothetical protein